ncbi:MAG: DNA polymerase III subunit gamma/tau [Pseudomonadales bacterium]|jgi:DNA polymerase-3 subunit gamma/tau|nr:DNA polymerase III subunit gamma/tau [Pseudomonadales bacterium]
MAWQNKHRPRQVCDLHLKKVRDTLTAFMENGKLPQVFLFAGPKGTGKTSSARIIAALLNDKKNEPLIDAIYFSGEKATGKFCEPSTDDSDLSQIFVGDSFAVVEMDAASNRRIEDVRNLQERIFMPSSVSKMTVYILDEAHMFTTEAFNALLKILEEPPVHCVFILATTEKHKIPATVISRCTVVDFVKATSAELVSAFEKVLAKEKIEFDPKALELLAQSVDGSFRDGIKTLETAAITGKVSLESVEQSLGSNIDQKVEQLLDLFLKKDGVKINQFFQELRQSGISETFFYKTLLNYLHNQWLISLRVEEGTNKLSTKQAVYLLTVFRDLKLDAPIGYLDIELKFYELLDKVTKKKSTA